MTNSKHFNIEESKKVCEVYYIISQVCKLRGFDWLEKELLNKWVEKVLEKQDEDEELSFIFAKYAFIEYLENYFMKDEPIIVFLIDAIKAVC